MKRVLGSLLAVVLSLSLVGSVGGGLSRARAAAKTLCVGLNMPLTGGNAEEAALDMNGAILAIEEANAKGGVAGYKIEPIILNDATATAGQYDPVQAATNARKLVANPCVVASYGPWASGSGKAMSPIFSQGDMATITGTATNPDITDPKFARQYRPAGKAVFFRTCTTDAYQGPGVANFFAEKLKVKSIYVLDDSGAYGVGIADSFQKRVTQKGIKVLGRDRIDPREADYTTILTKIKGLSPEALFLGGTGEPVVKLVKQAYDVIPNLIKGGGDGLFSPDVLKGAGFPAAAGWYASVATPHLTEDPKIQPWVNRFVKRFGKNPEDYSITSYDAMLVILDAINRVAASGKPVNRHTVRDAIQITNLMTLQGRIQFDENGDTVSKQISIYQVQHDPKYPDDDVLHQYHYIELAPEQ